MRFITILILLIACLPSESRAALFDRGGGMIYDDVLDITWLQDANAPGILNWDDASAWVNALGYGGYNDWRLASMDVDNDTEIIRCELVTEPACRDNELGYMFYYNLGGTLPTDLTGDQGFFTNIQIRQWSGTETQSLDSAYSFVFGSGSYFPIFKWAEDGVWAVRDGDVELTDTDFDGVTDVTDNCTLAANTDQRDSDNDGHGNVCDFDYTNDCLTNFADLGVFASAFGTASGDPGYDEDVDSDGNGVINFADFGAPPNNFATYFMQPPGPSATVCVPSQNRGLRSQRIFAD